MEEIQKKICKGCGELKERVFDGMYNKKDKRWKDNTEEGLLWNGLNCGSCNRERAKGVMRKTRAR